jgi:hypothetical protein
MNKYQKKADLQNRVAAIAPTTPLDASPRPLPVRDLPALRLGRVPQGDEQRARPCQLLQAGPQSTPQRVQSLHEARGARPEERDVDVHRHSNHSARLAAKAPAGRQRQQKRLLEAGRLEGDQPRGTLRTVRGHAPAALR